MGQFSWLRFFRGFSSTIRQLSGKLRPQPSPAIIDHHNQSRVFLVLIFSIFRHKISEFRITCFKFTQYFAKISQLIFIVIILESCVTYASKLISLFVNISQQLNKMYKIYLQFNYFVIFWQAKMKQVWRNKIYSVQLLKQFLRDLMVFILHNQTLIFSLFILLLSVSIKLHFRRKKNSLSVTKAAWIYNFLLVSGLPK